MDARPVRAVGAGEVRIRSATSRRSSMGVDVPPVTPTTVTPSKIDGSSRSRAFSIWTARVPTMPHSRVSSLVFAELRPPTTTISSTAFAASIVSCCRRIVTGHTVLTIFSSWARDAMNPASCSNFQGGCVLCERSAIRLRARDRRLPLLLLVDDDGVGREPQQADDLRVLGGAEQDDGVALLDELGQLLLLLDHPGARPVDDLEAPRRGAFHDARADPMRSDDDRRTGVDRVEVSTVSTPRACRSRMTPSLWTVWPRVWVRLPAAADSFALSIASRTP